MGKEQGLKWREFLSSSGCFIKYPVLCRCNWLLGWKLAMYNTLFGWSVSSEVRKVYHHVCMLQNNPVRYRDFVALVIRVWDRLLSPGRCRGLSLPQDCLWPQFLSPLVALWSHTENVIEGEQTCSVWCLVDANPPTPSPFGVPRAVDPKEASQTCSLSIPWGLGSNTETQEPQRGWSLGKL